MADASINFDLLARDRASDKFAKVGKAADTTGSKLSKLGKVAKVGMLGLAGATVAATGVLGLMVKAAIDDQKSQQKLATQLKNTTGATKTQIASVEDWITAQGKAFGVADDDLRPALVKLATATGDVSKSQQLASLAMNVSAGTGKSLEAVSAALAKAYTGNIGALGRLGIATKDASGHTKTFAQIQDDLGKKFKGQAATAADTFAGRVKRFKLAVSEAGETIGYAILPMLSRLAGLVVDKVIPAVDNGAQHVHDFFAGIRKSGPVQETFDKIKGAAKGVATGFDNAATALGKIKDAVGSIDLNNLDGSKIGKALGDAVLSGLKRLGQLAGKIGDVIGDMFAKVDWVGLGIAIGQQAPALALGLAAGLLNFDFGGLMRGVMAHWQVILIAVLSVAFAPSKFIGPIEKILTRIPFVGKFLAVALRWVNDLGGKLKSFGSDLLKTFWRGFTGTPVPGVAFVARVLRAVAGLPGALAGFFRTVETKIGVWALDAAEAMGRGFRTGAGKLLKFVGTIPGKIISGLGDLSGLLLHAGGAVIDGLVNGIRAGFGRVTSTLSSLAEKIPGPIKKVLGIHSPSLVFHNIGENIMQGLLNGMNRKWTPVKDFLQKVTDKVQATGQKLSDLISTRNDFAAGFQSFASSIFGRDPGTDANGNAIPETVAGIKAFQAAQQRQAAQLASNVRRLVGLGLSKSLLTQMQQNGSAGIAQINTLASSASKSDIDQLNRSDKATAASLAAAGMSAANAVYGPDIKKAQSDYAGMTAALKDLTAELRQHRNEKVSAHVSGSDLVIAIEREVKKTGKKPF